MHMNILHSYILHTAFKLYIFVGVCVWMLPRSIEYNRESTTIGFANG